MFIFNSLTPRGSWLMAFGSFMASGYWLVAAPLARAAEIVVPENVVTALPGPPGTTGVGGAVQNFYFLALLGAALFAFGIIIYAGIKYTLSAGKSDMQQDARDRIFNALWGMLLLFGAYIMLYTINPGLVNLDLPELKPPQSIPPTLTIPSSTAAGGPISPGEYAARNALLSNPNPIIINKAPCPPGVPYTSVPGGCTSVEGLTANTIQTLKTIKANCRCAVVISGGTELGHAPGPSGHISGMVVDLSFEYNLGEYLKRFSYSNGPLGIQRICTTPQNARYAFNCPSNPETEEHFHVEFSS